MATVHLTDEQWGFIEPLLPPPARTGRPRADDRMASAQTLGRGRHLGAHLAGSTGRPGRARPTRLVQGFPGWLVRAREARRRIRRIDEEGQGDEMDAGGRRQWPAARVSLGQCQPRGGAAGSADPGHDHSRSPAWPPQAATREAGGGPRICSSRVSPGSTPPRHPHVHSTQAASGDVEGQARTPGGCPPGRLSDAVHCGAELRLVGQLPAAADPLGAPVRRLPERIRFRSHAAVCAPSDCPRVPDPVELIRARAVYAARSVPPRWSTTCSGTRQPTRGAPASSAPRR